MSPVATSTGDPLGPPKSESPTPPRPHDAMSLSLHNIARHPSPWHEIAHTLSTTPSPAAISRRGSSPTLSTHSGSLPITATRHELESVDSPSIAALSSSQALRDWEARLASPDSDVRRHQLVHPPPPGAQAQLLLPTGTGNGSPVLPPKLAAERDKEGHIEYKLKLIDPSPERFGKLVTQMMWRLKQGKNEAIYEIGLADDGTVVGLTRAEMDASLKTLELMASELGATVMILREIVLSGAPSTGTIKGSPVSEASSSVMSTSSARWPEINPVWPVKRPDLDDLGRPKKGTRALYGNETKVTKKSSREIGDILPQYTAKQVIFNVDASNGSDGDSDHSVSSPTNPVKTIHTPGSDDDIPPFELDLDDREQSPVCPVLPTSTGRSWRRHKKKPQGQAPVSEHKQADPKKENAKRAKLARKREERRLDLLRGDGMSTTWLDLQSHTNDVDQVNPPTHSLTSQLLAKIPHQPARPSSLRLASPAPSTATIRPSPAEDLDEDGSLWGLSQTPLDSLSLSFADVQIQDLSPLASPTEVGSETAIPLPSSSRVGDDCKDFTRPLKFTGKEMVCVEALVVRKVQHGHGADADGDGHGSEEEECGWGGDDDVWGLGVDSD